MLKTPDHIILVCIFFLHITYLQFKYQITQLLYQSECINLKYVITICIGVLTKKKVVGSETFSISLPLLYRPKKDSFCLTR